MQNRFVGINLTEASHHGLDFSETLKSHVLMTVFFPPDDDTVETLVD